MRNKIILAGLIAVLLSSVAYASFSANLVINGTGTATGTWNVAITNITNSSQTGATNRSGTPSFTSTAATFNVDLAYPGATSTYQVTIRNTGNVSAKVDSITDLSAINATAPTYVTYAMTGIAVNDVLAPGATDVVTVTVTWAASATTNPSESSKIVTINFNFVQNT